MKAMLASVAVVLAACTQQVAQPDYPSSQLSANIDSVVTRFAALNGSPGLGVVVVRDTQIVYLRGAGYADVEKHIPFSAGTEFYIASTTKSFTGLAAAILAERGVWNLDAPVSRYLPQLRLKAPLDPDSITIRSLLTHTHGIAGGPVDTRLAFTGEYDGDAELIRLLAEHSALPSGRAFVYSNLGYNIAALAMDAVTRKSWKEVLQEEIFTPLKMAHTTAYVSHVARASIAVPYRATPTGFAPTYFGKTDANMQSAGGLITTLPDMATWLEVQLNNGKLDGRQVLPAAAVRESHKFLTSAQSQGRPWREIGYGLGWQIALRGTDTLFVHGGGFTGYATHMSFLPNAHAAVAVFANNAEIGGGIVDMLASALYDVVQGKPPVSRDSMAVLTSLIQKGRDRLNADLARRALRPQTLPYPLSAYTGTYRNPIMGTVQINEVNGKLEARFGAAWSAVETYDASKNQLRVEPFGNGEVVTVLMENGRATGLKMGALTFTRVP